MLIKRKLIPFILCVIMLIPLIGCSEAQQTAIESISAPETESSKPYTPVFDTKSPVVESEEEIRDFSNRKQAFSIEPLSEPKNGAMTYEEYFSEERFVQRLEKTFVDNLPDEIKNCSDWKYNFKDIGIEPYVVDTGDGYIVPLNRTEIWWYSYDFSEKQLIRRVAEYDLLGVVYAYNDILIWNEMDATRNYSEYVTYRLYIPTMQTEQIIREHLTPIQVTVDYGKSYLGFSTTTFQLNNFNVGNGIMVYCAIDESFYFVKVEDMINGWDLWPKLQEMKEKLNI